MVYPKKLFHKLTLLKEGVMSLQEVRARVKAGVWRAIANSKVDTSALPQESIDQLVGAITEGILTEIDDILGQSVDSPAAVPQLAVDEDVETVLWEGRPFLSISVFYQITNERVRIIEGFLAKTRRDVELVRIQDVDHKQNMTERAFSIGDVFIHSRDQSDPEIILNNIPNPAEVHEILRRAVLNARKKYGVSYREEM
jgi:hypothetical protein